MTMKFLLPIMTLLCGTAFGSNMPSFKEKFTERELSHKGGGYCDLTGMYETVESFEFGPYDHIADEIGRFALYCDEPLEFFLFACLAYDRYFPFPCPETHEDHYAFKENFEFPFDLPKHAKLCLVEGMLFDLEEDPLGHVGIIVTAPAREILDPSGSNSEDNGDGGFFEDVFGEAISHVLEEKDDCLLGSFFEGSPLGDEWMIGFQSKPGVLTIYLDDDGPVRHKNRNRHCYRTKNTLTKITGSYAVFVVTCWKTNKAKNCLEVQTAVGNWIIFQNAATIANSMSFLMMLAK